MSQSNTLVYADTVCASEKLLAPVGFNLLNPNRSLVPSTSAVAYDATSGGLYVGNSSSWVAAGGSGSNGPTGPSGFATNTGSTGPGTTFQTITFSDFISGPGFSLFFPGTFIPITLTFIKYDNLVTLYVPQSGGYACSSASHIFTNSPMPLNLRPSLSQSYSVPVFSGPLLNSPEAGTLFISSTGILTWTTANNGDFGPTGFGGLASTCVTYML